MNYSQHDGGPWDRGSADSYYRRGYNPHFFVGQRRVVFNEMTSEQIDAYAAGYNHNEQFGDKKDFE